MELRWKIHDITEDGPPPQEAIAMDGARQTIYRVLQYREYDRYGAGWSEWKNVKISF